VQIARACVENKAAPASDLELVSLCRERTSFGGKQRRKSTSFSFWEEMEYYDNQSVEGSR
jgi:hypothetical protein